MIVGNAGSVLVHAAPQDGVGHGIAAGRHRLAAVDEAVAMLGGGNGIEHDGQVAAGGVLHAHRDVHTAGHQPVLLILHGPGAHRFVGQQIVQITAILRIEHLVRRGEAGFLHGPNVQAPDGNDARQQVGSLVGLGLVQHSLVPIAGGAGFVGVDAGDDHQPVLQIFVEPGEPG